MRRISLHFVSTCVLFACAGSGGLSGEPPGGESGGLLEEGKSDDRAVAETPEVGEAAKPPSQCRSRWRRTRRISKHLFDESEKM